MNNRVFIDTNIFVYAHVAENLSKHEIATKLLKSGLTGSHLWISTQILSEFYSAMSKNNYEHDKIVELLAAIMKNTNMVSVSSETVEAALMIKGRYHFSYWDALMLAAALESGCDVVYTEDLQHNQIIESKLVIRNPFAES